MLTKKIVASGNENVQGRSAARQKKNTLPVGLGGTWLKWRCEVRASDWKSSRSPLSRRSVSSCSCETSLRRELRSDFPRCSCRYYIESFRWGIMKTEMLVNIRNSWGGKRRPWHLCVTLSGVVTSTVGMAGVDGQTLFSKCIVNFVNLTI